MMGKIITSNSELAQEHLQELTEEKLRPLIEKDVPEGSKCSILFLCSPAFALDILKRRKKQ